MHISLDELVPGLSWLLLFLVWIGGMIAACLRWRNHPTVAAIVLISMGCIALAAFVSYVLQPWIFRAGQARNVSMSSILLLIAVLNISGSLIRTAVWAAMLVAAFGWRPRGPADPQSESFYRFSIGGIMLLTLVVAIACAIVTGLIQWLGESAPILLTLVREIPLAVVWYIGARVAFIRWKKHPQVSAASLLAIGLSMTSLLLANANWMSLAVARGRPDTSYLLWALVSTILSAIAWMFLLAAALGGRSESENDPPVILASEPMPQRFTSA